MRKTWKITKWIFGLLVLFFILDFAIILSFANFSPKLEEADAIVILGAAINSPALYNRSLKALELYENEKAPLLVLSGGRISDQDISEATYMQRVIQKNTNKPLNLILEENSHTTFENFKNTKQKIPQAENIIFVTDKYHIARSFFTAKAAGFENVDWSTPNQYLQRPSDILYHYFREAVAMVNYLPKFVSN